MALIHSTISAKLGGCLHIIRYNPHPIRGNPAPTREEQECSIRSALAFEPASGVDLVITYLIYHLTEDGYPEIVMRPEYSLKEQISIFKNCNLVVGPHGAGLVNLIFCKRKTKVLEIKNMMKLHKLC